MVTKNPRQSSTPEEKDAAFAAAQASAQAAHDVEHQSFSERYGFGWVGNIPTTQGRSIPSANQVAAMKDHPEYEMWNDYRKEKD